MTDEEVLELHRRLHTVLAEALGPLLSQDGKKGVVAMRVFYMLMRDDGLPSAGQAGLTCEGHAHNAIELIRSIPTILGDPDGNRELRVVEAPTKS